MSRSGYSDDCYGQELMLWRGAVASAMNGKRGQQALKDIVSALDALPEKKLIHGSFTAGGFCTLGALAHHRGVDVSDLNPKRPETFPYYDEEVDRDEVGRRLDIAPALAAEVMFMNDEWVDGTDTPEERWERMRAWAEKHIKEEEAG